MNNNKKAIFYTLIDSVTYSFVPLLATFTINSIASIPYMIISLLFSLLAYIIYFKYIKEVPPVIFSREIVIYSLISGVGFALSHLLLLYSITESENKFLPAIIFQIYPLIVMVLLIFFKMSEEKITIEKLFLLLFALVGIVILNYDESILNVGMDTISIFLPAISAILLAFSIVYTLKLSIIFKSKGIKTSAFLSNFYSKVISFITMIPFLFWYLSTDYTFNLTIDNLLLMLVYGVLVLTFGTIFYYKGVEITSNSLSIHIISYISAILSVFWLWLFGFGLITSTVLIGSAFILTSNVLLHFNVDKSNAYNGSIIWTLIIGTFIFLYDATIYKNFYDALTSPLLFFVILLAFLIDRIFKRIDTEEELILSITSDFIKNSQYELVQKVIKLNQLRDYKKIGILYHDIIAHKMNTNTKLYIDKFMLSRIQRIKFTELVVLFLTAILSLYIIVFYKPDSGLNDIFRLCLSTAIIFNLLYVFDNERERSKNFILLNDKLETNINISMNQDETILEKIISVILLFTILSLFFFAYALN